MSDANLQLRNIRLLLDFSIFTESKKLRNYPFDGLLMFILIITMIRIYDVDNLFLQSLSSHSWSNTIFIPFTILTSSGTFTISFMHTLFRSLQLPRDSGN